MWELGDESIGVPACTGMMAMSQGGFLRAYTVKQEINNNITRYAGTCYPGTWNNRLQTKNLHTMKKLAFLIALLSILSSTAFAQVGFNNDGSQPDPSAGLDVKFSDKGFLVPRVALEQTSSASPVTSPALSLLVYNTATANDVTPAYYYWNGTVWVRLSTVPETGSENYIQNQTAADQAAGFRITGDGIFNGGNVGIGTTSPGERLDVVGGNIKTDNQLISAVATGTAPLSVSSSTLVTNLNADMLDGVDVSGLAASDHTHSLQLTGDVTGSGDVSGNWSTTLANSGVTAGSYGAATGATIPYFTVDLKGRLTSAVSRNLTPADIGGWSLSGNAGTIPGTSFIGTTDANDLVFKINGMESGRIGWDPNNTSFGREALFSNPSGGANSAFGLAALSFNTSGHDNTAVGAVSMKENLSGHWNTAVGTWSVYNNATGSRNVGIGNSALFSNISGSYNTAIGNESNVSSGNLTNATAIGANALVSISNSLVLGSIAGVNGATSSVNVGIGTTSPLAPLQVTANGTTSPLTNGLHLFNPVNSSGQNAIISARVAGTSAGDPFISLDVANEGGWSIGIDNSASKSLVFRNTWDFSGTDKLTLMDGGNVGIGTSNPSFMTQIAQDITMNIDIGSGSGQLALTAATDGTKRMVLGYDQNGNGFGYIKAGKFGTAYTNLALQPNGGNVGIGTTSPNAKLTVSGNAGSGWGNDAAIIINNTALNGSGWYLRAGAVGTAAGRSFSIADDLAHRLVINYPSGYIGLGTTTPVNRLDVAGGAVIGVTYSGTNTSPTNGLLVQGNVGIGTTNPGQKLDVSGNIQLQNSLFLSNGSKIAGMKHDGNDLFYIYNDNSTNGNNGVYLAENGQTWLAFSDARLKKDIEPVTGILNSVCELSVKRFHMISDPQDMTKRMGFIAQDVQKLFPDLVCTQGEYLGLSYSDFGVLSIEAIKELRAEKDAEINQLKVQIEEMRHMIEDLQGKASSQQSAVSSK